MFYTASDIAALCGVTEADVTEWLDAGGLPWIRPGEHRLVWAADLRGWLMSSGRPDRRSRVLAAVRDGATTTATIATHLGVSPRSRPLARVLQELAEAGAIRREYRRWVVS